MRAWRRVSIHWGLVHIPVGVIKATEDHDYGFHRYHKGKCGGEIGQPWTCKKCHQRVDSETVVSGCEHEGELVIITKEEMDELRAERSDELEVVQFCPVDEVDPILWESSYFLEWGGKKGDGYAMLLQSMEDKGMAAVVSMVLTTRPTMGIIRVAEHNDRKVLMLHTIRWHDEVRDASELKKLEYVASPAELEQASMLIDGIAGAFKPEEFDDSFTRRQEELIIAKAAGEKLDTTPHQLDEDVEDVSDLLAKLKASVAQQKELAKSRGHHPAGSRLAKKVPAKKAAPRKAPAKRAPKEVA